MVDISIPAGAVTCRDGDPTLTKKAQVAITGGQILYEDLSNGGKFNLADATALASSLMKGVAVSDAAIGEYVTAALPGSVVTVASSTFTPGTVYYLSETAGGWAPAADIVGSGAYGTLAAIGLTATTALILGTITRVAV